MESISVMERDSNERPCLDIVDCAIRASISHWKTVSERALSHCNPTRSDIWLERGIVLTPCVAGIGAMVLGIREHPKIQMAGILSILVASAAAMYVLYRIRKREEATRAAFSTSNIPFFKEALCSRKGQTPSKLRLCSQLFGGNPKPASHNQKPKSAATSASHNRNLVPTMHRSVSSHQLEDPASDDDRMPRRSREVEDMAQQPRQGRPSSPVEMPPIQATILASNPAYDSDQIIDQTLPINDQDEVNTERYHTEEERDVAIKLATVGAGVLDTEDTLSMLNQPDQIPAQFKPDFLPAEHETVYSR